MMYKIEKQLIDSGFSFEAPEQEELNEEFYDELIKFKSKIENEEEPEQLNVLDEKLVKLFFETHTFEDDEEILELQQKVADSNAEKNRLQEEKQIAEEKAIAESEEKARIQAKNEELQKREEERERKLAEIEEKAKLANDEKLYLLNNKRRFDYSELEKLGINLQEVGVQFEWNGYVFRKRQMYLEYTILSRPEKKV